MMTVELPLDSLINYIQPSYDDDHEDRPKIDSLQLIMYYGDDPKVCTNVTDMLLNVIIFR